MKFTKPISREVDIDGNTFVVTLDENGVEFRLKGKRKTARVDWVKVLDIAEGEQGSAARNFLGIGEGESKPQSAAPETQSAGEAGGPQGTGSTDETDAEISRSVTVGDRNSDF